LTNAAQKWESVPVPTTSESWFDKVEPWLDRILECLEVAMVLVLAAGILVATGYETIWIFHGDPLGRQARLAAALRGLNENWKALLLLLIPLFYRTIKGFLERVEEFAGAKARRNPKFTAGAKPNPPDPTQQEVDPADQSGKDREQG
jgi:hypothetical protein